MMTMKEDITVNMLRAFVTLARTLNLTEASKILGATRQTVRRHVSELEKIRGEALFTLEKHEYALTRTGVTSLGDARNILRQLESWSGQTGLRRQTSQGLEIAQFTDGMGRDFFSQQHSISSVNQGSLPILKTALTAWGESHTQIEDPAMSSIRPYLVIYRKHAEGWLCVEIGEKSAYAKWFGWTWSKSAIGRLVHQDNAGEDFNDFIAGAYARIYHEGGVRLDHLYAHLPRATHIDPEPVSFQRLLMGCVFPDNTPALAVLVLITNQIDIGALSAEKSAFVSDELIMDFDI